MDAREVMDLTVQLHGAVEAGDMDAAAIALGRLMCWLGSREVISKLVAGLLERATQASTIDAGTPKISEAERLLQGLLNRRRSRAKVDEIEQILRQNRARYRQTSDPVQRLHAALADLRRGQS